MIGTTWKSSFIENKLYDIMEDYEIGIELYEEDVIGKISDYFSCKPHAQWQLGCTEWPNMNGGTCYVSFLDDGTLHMISFDYTKEELKSE